MAKKVCLVLGAGAGIGGTVAKKFAKEGYYACLCRRSDQEGLNSLVDEIKQNDGDASGFMLDATEEGSLENLILEIEKDIGEIDVLVYNLGAQSGMKLLNETSLKEFEWGWQMGSFGLFRVAKVLMPIMAKRGSGTFLVTSATAAMRGSKNQHSHATAMGGRRMLCQTLNAEFASQGIHVAHVIVDGMVDAPDTLGKMLGKELFQELRDSKGKEDGLILPTEVAEAYYFLSQQHRSSWTHEIDIRSYSDNAWWN